MIIEVFSNVDGGCHDGKRLHGALIRKACKVGLGKNVVRFDYID
jgi:hypothetical protein